MTALESPYPLANIGELTEQIRGVSYKKQDAMDVASDGYLPILRAGNISEEGLIFEDLVFVPNERISPKQMIRNGDIVIAASSGSIDIVGKAALCKDDWSGSFGAFCKVLRPKQSIHPGYLAYFFRTTHYRHVISNLAAGANINNLRNEHLDGLKIPLPPLEEQKRIAAILDKADAIRRKREKAIELADEFLKSVFLDMFGDPVTNPKGWDVIYLKEAATFISGGTPSKSNPEFWQGEFPWVSPKDMKRIEITDAEDHISDDVFNQTRLKKIPENSILLVVRGMILAHTVPLAITKRLVAINQDMKAMISKAAIVPLFLLECLRAQHGNILSKVATAAHGTKRLEMREVETLSVLKPGVTLQNTFAEIWHKTKVIKSNLKTAYMNDQDLFNSLVQRAFRGELSNTSVAKLEKEVEDVVEGEVEQMALF